MASVSSAGALCESLAFTVKCARIPAVASDNALPTALLRAEHTMELILGVHVPWMHVVDESVASAEKSIPHDGKSTNSAKQCKTDFDNGREKVRDDGAC
jgi:hypothetical protein